MKKGKIMYFKTRENILSFHLIGVDTRHLFMSRYVFVDKKKKTTSFSYAKKKEC